MFYQRFCVPGTGRLLKANLKYKSVHLCSNANVQNRNYIKVQSVLRNKLSFFTPKRNFFQLFKKSTKNDLRVRDNVPDQYILIYRSRMDKYILYAQIITTLSAAAVFFMSIIKYDILNNQMDFSGWKTVEPRKTENEIFIYLSIFVTIVAILQLIVSRMPIRIYNLPQQRKYVLIFYGNYPFTQKKLVCKVGDVTVLPETGVLPWRQGRYLLKDQQQLILIHDYFRRPADLYIMLGIQKDPDIDDVDEKQ